MSHLTVLSSVLLTVTEHQRQSQSTVRDFRGNFSCLFGLSGKLLLSCLSASCLFSAPVNSFVNQQLVNIYRGASAWCHSFQEWDYVQRAGQKASVSRVSSFWYLRTLALRWVTHTHTPTCSWSARQPLWKYKLSGVLL